MAGVAAVSVDGSAGVAGIAGVAGVAALSDAGVSVGWAASAALVPRPSAAAAKVINKVGLCIRFSVGDRKRAVCACPRQGYEAAAVNILVVGVP